MKNPKLPQLASHTLKSWYTKYGASPVASLYVLNTSAQEANLMFSVQTANGSTSTVSIPYTFAPIDLTIFASVDVLIKSEELRKLINGNYIKIVDTEEVEEKALNHPAIVAELNRINNTNNQVIQDVDGVAEPIVEIEKNPLIANIIMLSSEESDEARLTQLLHANIGNLMKNELEFLRDNSKSRILSDFVLEALSEE